MASASSRPRRQARCGVFYRDPLFDYEEDLVFCRRLRSSTSKKRSKKNATAGNLTLIPTSRSKERAEAVQLQRAIDESLLDRVPEAATYLHKSIHEDLPDTYAKFTTSFSDHEKDVVEGEVMNSLFDFNIFTMDEAGYNGVAFQCLLDVASEAILEGDIHVCKPKDAKERFVEIQDTDHQVNNLDDTEWAATEADLSDELGCKTEKLVMVGRRKYTSYVVSPGQMKKGRSVRPPLNLKVETLSVGSCQTSLLSANKPLTQQVKACGGKENMSTSLSTPLMESSKSRDLQISYSKPQVSAENGTVLRSCHNVSRFPAQSSTVFHRRVIGLSRRFKPPPLHPYLSRQDR